MEVTKAKEAAKDIKEKEVAKEKRKKEKEEARTTKEVERIAAALHLGVNGKDQHGKSESTWGWNQGYGGYGDHHKSDWWNKSTNWNAEWSGDDWKSSDGKDADWKKDDWQ